MAGSKLSKSTTSDASRRNGDVLQGLKVSGLTGWWQVRRSAPLGEGGAREGEEGELERPKIESEMTRRDEKRLVLVMNSHPVEWIRRTAVEDQVLADGGHEVVAVLSCERFFSCMLVYEDQAY